MQLCIDAAGAADEFVMRAQFERIIRADAERPSLLRLPYPESSQNIARRNRGKMALDRNSDASVGDLTIVSGSAKTVVIRKSARFEIHVASASGSSVSRLAN